MDDRPGTVLLAPLATLINPEDADRLRPACDELISRYPHLFDSSLLSVMAK